jgi:hypothetical protein
MQIFRQVYKMSTVCWCPSSGSAPVTVTPSATDWDGHINTVQRPLNFERGGSAYASLTYYPDGADHLTDVATMIAAFVSPVLPPQTVPAQSVGFGTRVLETNTLNNQYFAWKLYGVNVAGDTNLGTLKAINKFVGSEFANVLTGKGQVQTSSAITFNEPWRLVLEVGSDGLPVTGGGRHNIEFEFGEALPTGSMTLIQDTDTTVGPSLLIFSQELILVPSSYASFRIGL